VKKITKFYADWCGPCVEYKLVFEHITKQLKGWEVEEYNVDTTEGQEKCMAFGVTSVPATVIQVDDNEPKVIIGMLSAEQLAKEVI
jgi:thiol-disulfide isomerase/thioredoxin